MKSICETTFITDDDATNFANSISETIDKMQSCGLTVEIQYHPIRQEYYNNILYTAFIIGRK